MTRTKKVASPKTDKKKRSLPKTLRDIITRAKELRHEKEGAGGTMSWRSAVHLAAIDIRAQSPEAFKKPHVARKPKVKVPKVKVPKVKKTKKVVA
jgi:hypothetical protein